MCPASLELVYSVGTMRGRICFVDRLMTALLLHGQKSMSVLANRKGSAHADDPGESRGGRGPNLAFFAFCFFFCFPLFFLFFFRFLICLCNNYFFSALFEDPSCTKCNK